jgi:hypothetical protein
MMTRDTQVMLLSLKDGRYFTPGYWQEFIASGDATIEITIASQVTQGLGANLGETIFVNSLPFLKLACDEWKTEPVVGKLESLTWYGAPGKVVYVSEDLQQIRLLEEYYEWERLDEMPGWVDDLSKDIKLISELHQRPHISWCFTWDADFVILLSDLDINMSV